jgi:hypothetical protein
VESDFARSAPSDNWSAPERSVDNEPPKPAASSSDAEPAPVRSDERQAS